MAESLRKREKKYGKMYGTFEGTTPTLHPIDTELIKLVCVKEFDRFVNRRVITVPSENWNALAVTNTFF